MKKIIFPAQPTQLSPTERNLLLTNDNMPILKAYAGNKRLLLFFDTGNNKADLFHTYYSMHQKKIDSVTTKDSITGGRIQFCTHQNI